VSLPTEVRTARAELMQTAAKYDSAAATAIASAHERQQPTASVAIVGETNRGKSSLINALLASPGLSPVAADVATSSYLVFSHADSYAAQAFYPSPYEPISFDVKELVHWMVSAADTMPPSYISVSAPIPLLQRLIILDTPGVGGLNSAHGELARAAVRTATGVVFVVDASAPLSSGELDFLRELSTQVETIEFVLTKTDAYRGWPEILRANQDLLAKHVPRFANARMHPVSARLFEHAVDAPNAEMAGLLREKSGVIALQAKLQELLSGRATMLSEANTLRALDTVFAGIADELTKKRRILSSGQEQAVELRMRRDDLVKQRRSSTRGWQVKLRGEVQRARVDLNSLVASQIRELQNWFRAAVEQADRAQLAAIPSDVDAALQVASAHISTALNERIAAVVTTTVQELFTQQEIHDLQAMLARGEHAPIELRAKEKRVATAEDKLLVMMGVSSGVGIGRIAALPLLGIGVGVATPFILPVTLVVGLGAGWWLARTRKHSADKQYAKQWLTEAISEARATLDQLVAEQFIAVDEQLSLALDEAASRRIEAIEEELKSIDDAVKLATTDRNEQLLTLRAQLAEVETAGRATCALLTKIRAVRDA
jgi:GTPase Era involved in 16S rRNA processing